MRWLDWISDPWPEERRWSIRRFYRFNEDAADARADANIGAQMLWGHKSTKHEAAIDIDRRPQPDERPHRRAQWDEVRGRWVEWDEVDDEWDDVEVTTDDDATSPGSA